MSNRELISAYKEQLKDLTEEKQDLIKLAEEKDARIKKLLIQLEQANADIENLGKRVADVEAKAKKKDKIKKIINQKIDEVLEKKMKLLLTMKNNCDTFSSLTKNKNINRGKK